MKLHSSNFRVIAANFSGVRNFRTFTVLPFVILNGALIVHVRGNQLVPELLVKHSDT